MEQTTRKFNSLDDVVKLIDDMKEPTMLAEKRGIERSLAHYASEPLPPEERYFEPLNFRQIKQIDNVRLTDTDENELRVFGGECMGFNTPQGMELVTDFHLPFEKFCIVTTYTMQGMKLFRYEYSHFDGDYYTCEQYSWIKDRKDFKFMGAVKCKRDYFEMLFYGSVYQKGETSVHLPCYIAGDNARSEEMQGRQKFRAFRPNNEDDLELCYALARFVLTSYGIMGKLQQRKRITVERSPKAATSSGATHTTATTTPTHKVVKISDTIKLYAKDDTIKHLRKRRKCDHEYGVIGHERHYKSGKVVWVKPYTRNKNASEKVVKTYKL